MGGGGGMSALAARDRSTSAAVTVLLRGRADEDADEGEPDNSAVEGCSGLDRGANAAEAMGGLECGSDRGDASACVPHCITNASSSAAVTSSADEGELMDASELNDSHAPGCV